MCHANKIERAKDELGAVLHAFNTSFDKNNGNVAMLVNCTSQESMFQTAIGFRDIPEIKALVEIGELVIFTFCSGKVLAEGEEIPPYTINGVAIDDPEKLWKQIDRRASAKLSFVIFHVQMLGIGTDLPSLNSIVILGDKNKTDLFQTIMRGCRIDQGNPDKKSYDVFIFVQNEVKSYMKNFIDTLDQRGGPELIEAFSNDVLQGETTGEEDSLFRTLLSGTASYSRIIAEYQQLVECAGYRKSDLASMIAKRLLEYEDAGDMESYRLLLNQARAEI